MTDCELLALYRSDPHRAAAVTADLYTPYVLAVVRDKLAAFPREDIEETVSDVFIRFWQNADKVDLSRGSIKAYICVLAKSTALRRREQLAAQPTHAAEEEMFSAADEDTPESSLRRRELLARLSELSDSDRKAIVMRYFYGMPHGEIARQLGIKETAVRKRIERALKKLGKDKEGLL